MGSWSQVMLADRTSQSPFQLIRLIKNARRIVFIAGQNVFSLTCGKVARNEHEIIRAYTAWSIGKINTKTGKKMLYSSFKKEKSQVVKAEIECIL